MKFDVGSITLDGELVFSGLSPAVTTEQTTDATTLFLVVEAEETNSRLRIDLGTLPALRRWVVCHRSEPYWMRPMTGTRVSDVAPETQMLLGQLQSGKYLLLVPLFDELFRFFLRGMPDRHLELVGETGDSHVAGKGGLALFVAVGRDPFEMVARCATVVAERLGRGELRRNKSLPDFVEYFGWCTWDAFYDDVSTEKLRAGLASFREGGVEPRFVILDDGWQSTVRRPTGERRLTAFSANQKFPGGLSEATQLAKGEFGVSRFLVWHCVHGYWGGVDGSHFPEFEVVDQTRQFGEGILAHEPRCNQDWWGNLVGLVVPEQMQRFYDEYHRRLAAQGVDGVKVDSQAVLEGVSQRLGGRVRVTTAYRTALEASVAKHFGGRLLNCMSHNQETLYGSKQSTLVRGSIDFFPQKPEFHGLHVYTNAMVGLWFGEFMHPDWDMFQSDHAWGRFHAASRAVSGGPVYCSDKPEAHDFALLRELVCSDGTILRCDQPGLPTLDVLFSDPTLQPVLWKVWNRNGKSGILGVFHARFGQQGGDAIHGTVRSTDILGLSGEEFACYAFRQRSLERVERDTALGLSLREVEFELFTFVPIEHGFAAIGLADKMNSAGAVITMDQQQEQRCELQLRDAGLFLAYAETAPRKVLVDNQPKSFEYDVAAKRLEIPIASSGRPRLVIEW